MIRSQVYNSHIYSISCSDVKGQPRWVLRICRFLPMETFTLMKDFKSEFLLLRLFEHLNIIPHTYIAYYI